MPARLEPDGAAMPRIVAGRYEVQALLAQGGMARVYRARDVASGAIVALKWLDLKSGGEQTMRSIELLEREYHTLVQLAHPRVVQAYEYGVDCENPYYTMELLDGGDLRELAPMPWQEVCRVAFDVCSALFPRSLARTLATARPCSEHCEQQQRGPCAVIRSNSRKIAAAAVVVSDDRRIG